MSTPKESEMVELKPCPFCGEQPLEDRIEPHEHSDALTGLVPLPFSYPGSWSVECVKCECRIFSHDSREEAVRRWNLRAPALVLSETEREALACADYYLVKASRMQATPQRNHEIGQYAIALRAIASRGKL